MKFHTEHHSYLSNRLSKETELKGNTTRAKETPLQRIALCAEKPGGVATRFNLLATHYTAEESSIVECRSPARLLSTVSGTSM